MASDNSDRLLYLLKSRGPVGTSSLARTLGITEVGVRQHLANLHDDGLVAFEDQAGAVGRPKRIWRLTDKGHARFPDTHGDLTVSLIGSIRSVFGEPGLDRLIEARQEAMVASYRQALRPCADLGDRVRVLARLRTAEGYMAEFKRQADGSFLLIENHCPICAAAKTCQGFCRSELEQFHAAFGAGVSVTREEHLLSEGRRCVYRITSSAAPSRGRKKRGDDDPPSCGSTKSSSTTKSPFTRASVTLPRIMDAPRCLDEDRRDEWSAQVRCGSLAIGSIAGDRERGDPQNVHA